MKKICVERALPPWMGIQGSTRVSQNLVWFPNTKGLSKKIDGIFLFYSEWRSHIIPKRSHQFFPQKFYFAPKKIHKLINYVHNIPICVWRIIYNLTKPFEVEEVTRSLYSMKSLKPLALMGFKTSFLIHIGILLGSICSTWLKIHLTCLIWLKSLWNLSDYNSKSWSPFESTYRQSLNRGV